MIEHSRYARLHAADMDEESFLKDLKTIHAVTRCIEIIGEAARGVPEEIRARAPGVPWAQIVGTRNILAHAYGRVDGSILYRLLHPGLALLESELSALLAE